MPPDSARRALSYKVSLHQDVARLFVDFAIEDPVCPQVLAEYLAGRSLNFDGIKERADCFAQLQLVRVLLFTATQCRFGLFPLSDVIEYDIDQTTAFPANG